MYTYEQLRPEIEHMLATVRVTRAAEAKETAARLLKSRQPFEQVYRDTRVPVGWMLPTWEREDPSFSVFFGNGNSLLSKTKDVPRNQGPFITKDGKPDWVRGTKVALHIDHIDSVPEWTLARAVYEWELWNGFGPRGKGRVSGYPWSGTAFYDPPTGKGGKYTADDKWSWTTVDQQLGCVPIYLALVEMDPTLAIPSQIPMVIAPPTAPAPMVEDTAWVQASLNKLWQEKRAATSVDHSLPLDVDGVYGRITARVVRAYQSTHQLRTDGIAGPQTKAAIEKDLAA